MCFTCLKTFIAPVGMLSYQNHGKTRKDDKSRCKNRHSFTTYRTFIIRCALEDNSVIDFPWTARTLHNFITDGGQ